VWTVVYITKKTLEVRKIDVGITRSMYKFGVFLPKDWEVSH